MPTKRKKEDDDGIKINLPDLTRSVQHICKTIELFDQQLSHIGEFFGKHLLEHCCSDAIRQVRTSLHQAARHPFIKILFILHCMFLGSLSAYVALKVLEHPYFIHLITIIIFVSLFFYFREVSRLNMIRFLHYLPILRRWSNNFCQKNSTDMTPIDTLNHNYTSTTGETEEPYPEIETQIDLPPVGEAPLSAHAQNIIDQLKTLTATSKDKSVQISLSDLSNGDARAIGNILKTNQICETLTICCPSMNQLIEPVDQLMNALHANKSVSSLIIDFSKTVILDVSRPISTLFQVNKCCNIFGLQDAQLSDDELRKILITRPHLIGLYIADLPILSEQSAKHLANFLHKNYYLESLHIELLQLDDDWVIILAKALRKSMTLKVLSVANSLCGNRGAEAFGKMLEVNKSLLKLNLQNNRISCAGAKSLAEGLDKNSTLRKLYIGGNRFRENDTGGNEIEQKKNRSLHVVYKVKNDDDEDSNDDEDKKQIYGNSSLFDDRPWL